VTPFYRGASPGKPTGGRIEKKSWEIRGGIKKARAEELSGKKKRIRNPRREGTSGSPGQPKRRTQGLTKEQYL